MGINTSTARGLTPGTSRRLRRNRGGRQQQEGTSPTVGSTTTETPGSLEPRSQERLLSTSPDEGSVLRAPRPSPNPAGMTPDSLFNLSTTESSPALEQSPLVVSPSPYTPAPIAAAREPTREATTDPTHGGSPRTSELSHASNPASSEDRLSPEAQARIGDSGDPRRNLSPAFNLVSDPNTPSSSGTHPSTVSAGTSRFGERPSREDTACATGEQTASECSTHLSGRWTSSSASSSKYFSSEKKKGQPSPSPDPRRNLTPDFQTPPAFKDTPPVREASATSVASASSTSSPQHSSSPISGRGGPSGSRSPTSLRAKYSTPYLYPRPRTGASPAFQPPQPRGDRPSASPSQPPISVDRRSRGSALHPIHRNQTHLLSTSQRCADHNCPCHTGCGKPECTVCQRKKVTIPALEQLQISGTPAARKKAMPKGSPHPRSGSAGRGSAGKSWDPEA